jgi:CxxC motif-containing protein
MIREFTCIECPKGCRLTVKTDDTGVVTSVTGNSCPKGDAYGRAEVEHPVRMLTSTVMTDGLSIKMLPVRTSAPIPKDTLGAAMTAIQKITIRTPVAAGDTIVKNFLNMGVDLIATREAVHSDTL